MYVANPSQPPADVFMYTLHPVRHAMLTDGPTPAEQELAASHWAYSQQLLERRSLVYAGRTRGEPETTFAFVVVHAPTREAAGAIMQADPAVRGGMFRATLHEFEPMLVGEWPPAPAG